MWKLSLQVRFVLNFLKVIPQILLLLYAVKCDLTYEKIKFLGAIGEYILGYKNTALKKIGTSKLFLILGICPEGYSTVFLQPTKIIETLQMY